MLKLDAYKIYNRLKYLTSTIGKHMYKLCKCMYECPIRNPPWTREQPPRGRVSSHGSRSWPRSLDIGPPASAQGSIGTTALGWTDRAGLLSQHYSLPVPRQGQGLLLTLRKGWCHRRRSAYVRYSHCFRSELCASGVASFSSPSAACCCWISWKSRALICLHWLLRASPL